MNGNAERDKAIIFMAVGLLGCAVGWSWQVHATSGFNVAEKQWWIDFFRYWKAHREPHQGIVEAFKQAAIIWGGAAMAMTLFANWRWSMRRTEYGSARWARPRDVKKMGLFAKRGVVLGQAFGRLLMSDAFFGTLAFAAPGAGKTQGLVIPTLLCLGRESSAVVHDPAGELHAETAGVRAALGKVVRIEWSAPDTARWNPLEGLPADRAELQTEIDGMWEILVPRSDRGDAQFDDMGRSFGAAATFFCVLDARERGSVATFADVFHWLARGEASDPALDSDDPAGAFLTAAASRAEGLRWPEAITTIFRRMAMTGYRERSGYLNTMQRGLSPWKNEHVARATGGSDFSIQDLRGDAKGRPVTVYLCVREKDLRTFGPISRIFCVQVMRHLLSQTKEEAAKGCEVSFVLDEAAALGAMPEVLIDGPSRGRKLRTRFLVIVQAPSQLRAIYGPHGFDTIRTVYQLKSVYHQVDGQVQRELAEVIGHETRIKKTLARFDPSGKSRLAERQLEGQYLIRPEDIGALGEGECFILAPHNTTRPIKARGAFPWKVRRLGRMLAKHRRSA